MHEQHAFSKLLQHLEQPAKAQKGRRVSTCREIRGSWSPTRIHRVQRVVQGPGFSLETRNRPRLMKKKKKLTCPDALAPGGPPRCWWRSAESSLGGAGQGGGHLLQSPARSAGTECIRVKGNCLDGGVHLSSFRIMASHKCPNGTSPKAGRTFLKEEY